MLESLLRWVRIQKVHDEQPEVVVMGWGLDGIQEA